MIVKGLDRIEGTPIFGMSDALWKAHTTEIRARFAQQQQVTYLYSRRINNLRWFTSVRYQYRSRVVRWVYM